MALHPTRAPLPLVVIAHEDPGTADSLRHAVEATAGWRAAVADQRPGGLSAALAASPALALVGCGALADLPAGYRVPLLAVGDDNRPADLRAALAAGAHGLLPWPDGAADLPAELARIAAETRPSMPAEQSFVAPVIAVLGVQGGAGATTVAAHLAAAWSRYGPAPVFLADLAGGLAYRLDLAPGVRTWSDLLPTPAPGATAPHLENGTASPHAPEPASEPVGPYQRYPAPALDLGLDGQGLAAALAEPWPGLSVLPLAALTDGGPEPPPDPWLVQVVLDMARSCYQVIVLDLAPASSPVLETALELADVLLAVGRCESAGVHGVVTALEAWNALGRDPATGGAVLTGVRSRAPVAPSDARKALGDRLWAAIPAANRELATAAEDGMLLLDRDELPVVQAMLTLANRVIPFPAVDG